MFGRHGKRTSGSAAVGLARTIGVAGLLLGTGAAHGGERGRADERPPNLIVLIADDLPRGLCTFLPEGEGRALMPTMHRLASEGVVLDRMRSPSPVCTPSRFALLMGTYPSRCDHPHFLGETRRHDGQTVVQFGTHIRPRQETLAAWLGDAGYTTGVVGKNHVIAAAGYQRLPYDADPNDPDVARTLRRNAAAVRRAFLDAGFDEAEALYHGNPDADGIRALAVHNQEWITAAALGFIDRNAEDPFFLLMSTTLTHGPYAPERSYRADPTLTPLGSIDVPEGVQAPRSSIDARLEDAGIAGFNVGSVLWLDDAVSALMDRLGDHGIEDDTVLLVLSDHGMGAKGTTYEGALRTAAFMWRDGGFDAGGVVHADLSLVDIAPTLLDLAGAEHKRAEFDGVSFVPVLAGDEQRVRDVVYSEIGFSRAVMKDGMKYIALRYPGWAEEMSLDERRARLERSNKRLRERGIQPITEDPTAPFSHLFLIPGGHDTDRRATGAYPAYAERDQLYDLRDDPNEQRNLAFMPEHAETLREMQALLDAYVSELPGRFGEFGAAGLDE